jgi:peptidoglycan/LPS O-acetylase OafA/YrhL
VEIVPAQPRSHTQFPLFDSLRALAAISILLVHTAIFTGAFDDPVYGQFVAHLDIGVPFFFLLSAFLLYRPFVASRVGETSATAFPTYARRRFLRIVPAYWFVLTFAAIVPGLAGAFSGNWWVYYGLLQNYPVYTPNGTCAVDGYRCAIPPTWSLAIEVAFYVVLPFFVLAMAWLTSRFRKGAWLRVELIVIVALSAVSVLIQSSVPLSDSHVWLFFSPLGRFWWFGLGLGLAALSVWVERRVDDPAMVDWLRRRPGVPIAVGGALYLIACLTFLGPTPSLSFAVNGLREYVAQYLLFGVIAALVLLPAIFGKDGGGFSRSVLGHRTLSWLGLISYGIFLWQFPVIIFLVDDVGIGGFLPSLAYPVLLVATLAGTIVCAALSYYLLERPLMRWGRSR